MSDLFERVVLPVADPEDAAASCRALSGHDVGSVLAVHVVEKGGGAPDKASVEQREKYAIEVFEVVRDHLGADFDVETEITYGTDVAEAIFAAADGADATAIVITPRGGSRWIRLLTGDVALSLVTESDRPVVVLPDVYDDDEAPPVETDVRSAPDADPDDPAGERGPDSAPDADPDDPDGETDADSEGADEGGSQ
ncbi:MAG: universal stress protein [Haloarculaceae archaeon]